MRASMSISNLIKKTKVSNNCRWGFSYSIFIQFRISNYIEEEELRKREEIEDFSISLVEMREMKNPR